MQKGTSIHTLYNQLGDTISDILAHNDCPPTVYNELVRMMTAIDNTMPGRRREIALARGSFVGFLSALTESPADAKGKKNAARA